MNKNFKSSLLGLIIGDALGVPVEFKSREILLKNPVKDMIGYGTHNQPIGTWSDDTSLTLCLMDSLCNGYNLKDIAEKIVYWYYNANWTPFGEVFDVGIATQKAVVRLKKFLEEDSIKSIFNYNYSERDNGNGSLMRILPLVFFIKNMEIKDKYKYIREVSYLTHGHIRSIISCLIYASYISQILDGKNKVEAYISMQKEINNFIQELDISNEEVNIFNRILKKNIFEFPINEIYSSGYVIHTLESSIWNIINFDSFESSVLSAVNMGDDTDTTGAVTGSIAGLIYGIDSIPKNWISKIVRLDDINNLIIKFEQILKLKS